MPMELNSITVPWAPAESSPLPNRFTSHRKLVFATIPPPILEPVPEVSSSTLQGGEAFEHRARSMLGEGDADNAQEVLAAALCVYPRSRPLRSLYYVASALTALEKGEVMLATSQLETALAHHEDCVEAAMILEHVRKHGASDTEDVWKLFTRPTEVA